MNASEPDMKPESQPEESLFQAAAQLAGAARAAFLNGACHGNPAIRRRIEALLAALHGMAGGHPPESQVGATGWLITGVPSSSATSAGNQRR